MSRWFRFYAEALDDPKVQRLDGDTFKAWVNLLCLAARNDGFLPEPDDIAFALRMDNIAAGSVVDRLRIAGLIDVVKGGANGARIAPHGWQERQYKSDTSTDRVKRFRQRSKAVTETPPDTETDTEVSVAKATGASADPDRDFWRNAKSYLGPYVGGESKAGALIGKWSKGGRQADAARAISAAQVERAVDPVAYITAAMRRNNAANDQTEASKAGVIW